MIATWTGDRVTLACGHAFLQQFAAGAPEIRIGKLYVCVQCPRADYQGTGRAMARPVPAVDTASLKLSRPPDDWDSIYWRIPGMTR